MPAQGKQGPAPEYQWVGVTDFTPGIISQSNYAYATTAGNPVPGNKAGMAQQEGTVGCIALPNGGLGPLPSITRRIASGYSPPSESFVVGALVYGSIAATGIANGDEVLWAWECLDGSGDRTFQLTSYLSAVNVSTPILRFGPLPNVPGVAYERFSGGPTRVNTSDPTLPGQPCIAFAYSFVNTSGDLIYNAFYPDPSAPGSPGTLNMTPAYPGWCVPHQSRVVILSEATYQWIGTIGGGETLIDTNENFNYTDPPNSVEMGAQQEVFIAEQPFGMGAWGSISAGELFLVKHAGGGFVIFGDLDTPTVTYLAGVQPTKGLYSQAAQTLIGLVYGSANSGVWVWNGGNTAQKLSNNLNDDFYSLGQGLLENQLVGFSATQWNNWIAMTNSWVYDTVAGGWWRLADPGFDPLYYGSAYNDAGLWAVARDFTLDTDTVIAYYDTTVPQGVFSWQSYPMPETVNQILDIREASIRAQGIGTVELIATARGNNHGSVTLTFDSLTQPDLQRGTMGLENASDVTITLLSTGTGGHPAPVIYSASIAYVPTSPANPT